MHALNREFETLLARLDRDGHTPLLAGGLKGLEKESLRLSETGRIAQTPHPAALGSALTHPHITTDYSEALPELITPPFADPADTLRFLEELHRFVYRHLEDELLLASSMPCGVDGDASIPIAEYGASNIGRMKHVYRQGLGWRYGRAMQSIAGIHFNYSVPEALWPVLQEIKGDARPPTEFVADTWFGLIRNILRHGWLVLYLFGASPALCKEFFKGREHLAAGFGEFDSETLFKPWATSLRMSDIGYRNNNQSGLDVSFNSLGEYAAALCRAIATPSEEYRRIGVEVEGEYRQLNVNILQIENEYYNSVRPKQIARSGEKPTLALKKRGIRYVELRSIDLNPFQPCGIDLPGLRVLETFLLWCLFQPSPPLSPEEKEVAGRNLLSVATEGRKPGLTLVEGERAVPLRVRGSEILQGLTALAELLDAGRSERPYSRALEAHHAAVADPELTPSARVLAEMRGSGQGFADFALDHSRRHARWFRAVPLLPARQWALERQAEDSHARQRRIEAEDRLSFEEFLYHYFSQE
jgi:glutamate--cysteine ligase